MKHRHLDIPQDEYSIAAIDSIMERGGASDIKRLLATIKSDPFSETAENALEAAGHSEVYGYPDLIMECIRVWRQEHQIKT